MTMTLTSVTMVGWPDVPDSDWGDFRSRRAVDISSFVHATTAACSCRVKTVVEFTISDKRNVTCEIQSEIPSLNGALYAASIVAVDMTTFRVQIRKD